MIPKIIHQVWLGSKPIPEQLTLWSEDIRSKHADWDYLFWDEARCAEFQEQTRRCHTLGGASNVIRLHALERYGGVYLDMDIECLRPLDPLMNVPAFGALDGGYYDGGVYDAGEPIVCNAVMGAVPGHRWIREQVAALDEWLEREPPWGPKLATISLGPDVHLYPTAHFYPYSHTSLRRDVLAASYLVHHWMGLWG